MEIDALAVANYFVELARKEGADIRPLGLVKRVYIAHGFSLAIQDRPLLNPRFDRVEAWRYGPVIPSVYHSFKQYKDNAIKDYASNVRWNECGMEEWYNPMVDAEDKSTRKIVELVWNRYKNFTDGQLVTLLHKEGTPWQVCYVPNANAEIPDSFTKLYYEKLVRLMLERKRATA